MFGGLAKTAVVVGLGAVAAQWYEMDDNMRNILLASLGTAGLVLTIATRDRKLKSQGKAVFITGCDSGFGHALAKHLDKQGMRVFAGCLFADGEGAKELQESCSDRLAIIQLNVSKDDQVKEAEAQVRRLLDGQELWGLVNNAGIMSFCDVEVTPIKEWQRLFDINCLGQVRMIQAFLPLLRRSKGRIVNVASTHGRSFMTLYGAYCASKAGVEMYSECLRLELKKWGMHVAIIEPSGFGTNLVANSERQQAYFNEIHENLTEEQKLFYNKEYFDTVIQRFYFPHKKHVSEDLPTDLSPVVNSITHALLSTRPKVHYIAGRGGGFLVSLGTLFPYLLSNRILLDIVELNKPKGLQPTVEQVYGKK